MCQIKFDHGSGTFVSRRPVQFPSICRLISTWRFLFAHQKWQNLISFNASWALPVAFPSCPLSVKVATRKSCKQSVSEAKFDFQWLTWNQSTVDLWSPNKLKFPSVLQDLWWTSTCIESDKAFGNAEGNLIAFQNIPVHFLMQGCRENGNLKATIPQFRLCLERSVI